MGRMPNRDRSDSMNPYTSDLSKENHDSPLEENAE